MASESSLLFGSVCCCSSPTSVSKAATNPVKATEPEKPSTHISRCEAVALEESQDPSIKLKAAQNNIDRVTYYGNGRFPDVRSSAREAARLDLPGRSRDFIPRSETKCPIWSYFPH
jgi:hypothetical protein